MRRNTTERFGPVRVVKHEPNEGLVLEVVAAAARGYWGITLDKLTLAQAAILAAAGRSQIKGVLRDQSIIAAANAPDCETKPMPPACPLTRIVIV